MTTTLLTFSASEEVKMKWKEPYVTEGLNRKLAVINPPGIYRGFKLGEDSLAGDRTVEVVADTENTDHVALVQTLSGFSLTVRKTGGSFLLDLSSIGSATDMILAISGAYAIGATTTVVVNTYTQAEYLALSAAAQKELVVLGEVTFPGAGAITAANINPSGRDMAWASRAPGSMIWFPIVKNGSFEAIEELATHSKFADFWVAATGATIDWTAAGAAKRTGNYGLSATENTGGASSGVISQDLMAELPTEAGTGSAPGRMVRVVVHKKIIQAATVGNVKIIVSHGNPNVGYSDTSFDIPSQSTDGSFVKVERILQLPWGSTHIRYVRIDCNSVTFPAASTAFYIDGFQVFVESTLEDIPSLMAQVGGKLITSELVLRPLGVAGDLAQAHLTFDDNSPSGEGRIIVGKRDEGNVAEFAPALNLLGRLFDLGASLLGTSTLSLLPRISTKVRENSGADRTLLWEHTTDSSAPRRVRLYSDWASDHIEVTYNAVYDNSTNQWNYDDSTDKAWVIRLGAGVVTWMMQQSAGAAWLDNAWDETWLNLSSVNETLSFMNTILKVDHGAAIKEIVAKVRVFIDPGNASEGVRVKEAGIPTVAVPTGFGSLTLDPFLAYACGAQGSSTLKGGITAHGLPVKGSHFRDDFFYHPSKLDGTVLGLPAHYSGLISAGGIIDVFASDSTYQSSAMVLRTGVTLADIARLDAAGNLPQDTSFGFRWVFRALLQPNNTNVSEMHVGLDDLSGGAANLFYFYNNPGAFSDWRIQWWKGGVLQTPIPTGVISGNVPTFVEFIQLDARYVYWYIRGGSSSAEGVIDMDVARFTGIVNRWFPYAMAKCGTGGVAAEIRLVMWEWYDAGGAIHYRLGNVK